MDRPIIGRSGVVAAGCVALALLAAYQGHWDYVFLIGVGYFLFGPD